MRKTLHYIAVLGLLAVCFLPVSSEAAQITARSLTLADSGAGATTTHAFAFTLPTTGNVGSILFEYCTTASGACTKPTGLTTTSATLAAQSGTGATGFSIFNTNDGAPYITRSASSITGGVAVSYTLGAVVNPSAVNSQFWVRISTYASTDTTGGSTDTGVVAADTTQVITVTGTMPESLVFCVGTSGTDCGSMTGSAVALGTFSPTASNVGTSVMSASTNAGSGYSIVLSGTTLASGINTIPAMGTQTLNSSACSPSCTSATGTSQFGTNVRANNVSSAGGAFGADVSGTGTGAGVGGYNTANAFRFFTGDSVASVAGATKANLFTNSYLVNVGGDQTAGVYTATLTYTCTATF